jgi:hypothetical protein
MRDIALRWILVVIKSLAAGALAIVLVFVALTVGAELYRRYVLRLGPNEMIGCDPVSLFGHHWAFFLVGIPVLIFLVGFAAGFWFFSTLRNATPWSSARIVQGAPLETLSPEWGF